MLGLDKMLHNSRQLLKNTKNRIEYGIESVGNKIREKVETAKEVMPYALMNTLISNRWGQVGYYGAEAVISYKMAKQAGRGNIGGYGKGNSKIPLIVGAISGAFGLGIGILLGDLNSLIHQNHDLEQLQNLEQKYEQLQQQYQNVENQDQQLLQEVQYLQNQNQYLQIQDQQLQQEVQSLEQQLQNANTLTDVLFGKGNSNDISVIQVSSVQIENGTAYIQGTVGFTGDKVTLEIPIGYVENNKVNIQEFASDVQQYQQKGWNPYIAIDRADLQYMNLLNNQNSTYVISIQPNEPINIGVMASTADSLTLDNVLNNLTKYNIIIQKACPVYNSPFVLKGYSIPNNSNVVIDFQNLNQYEQALTMINIADQSINSPYNADPTSSGVIYTYSIFRGNMSVYLNDSNYYPEYIVGKTYIPLIVLQSQQGNTIINNVSS
jgi:hypothetical protein